MEASDFPALPDGRRPLSDKVASVVTEAVRAGRIRPGHYLPAEEALARHWGVSRPTVHRGFLAAVRATEGLLHLVRGNGWQVPWRTEETVP